MNDPEFDEAFAIASMYAMSVYGCRVLTIHNGYGQVIVPLHPSSFATIPPKIWRTGGSITGIPASIDEWAQRNNIPRRLLP